MLEYLGLLDLNVFARAYQLAIPDANGIVLPHIITTNVLWNHIDSYEIMNDGSVIMQHGASITPCLPDKPFAGLYPYSDIITILVACDTSQYMICREKYRKYISLPIIPLPQAVEYLQQITQLACEWVMEKYRKR